MSTLTLLVSGCKGRMGQAIIRCAGEDAETEVGGAIDLGDPLEKALAGCDCVIDFSNHGFTRQLVAACGEQGVNLVLGTTGHTQDELEAVTAESRRLPIVMAPNFSVGVNTLFWLTRRAAEILGPDFDLEIVEMHHRHKTDAPSGTAKRLAEILAETRGLNYESAARHGRKGDVGARTDSEIGVHALRGGDVVGDHTVTYAGAGERIELTHRASSRDTFALGAIRAAKWLASRPAGLYDMQDVLGLR